MPVRCDWLTVTWEVLPWVRPHIDPWIWKDICLVRRGGNRAEKGCGHARALCTPHVRGGDAIPSLNIDPTGFGLLAAPSRVLHEGIAASVFQNTRGELLLGATAKPTKQLHRDMQ